MAAVEELKAIVERIQKTRDSEALKNVNERSDAETMAEKQKTSLSELEQRGIMRRFQSVSFDTMNTVPKEIAPNARICREYANDISKHIQEDGQGLILLGGYGTMKTTLAVCILRATLEKGFSGLFVPMCSLMDNLFTMRTLNREEWARYEQRIRNTRLLVLDDFGGENTDQSWVLSKVDSILTERYNRMYPTVITTNYTLEDMAGTYSGRLIDRLISTNRILEFKGRSHRKAVQDA